MTRNTLNEQLERQIVAHLDGELDEAERADLYRDLLRDRTAREAMDRYQALDQLAGSALRTVLATPSCPFPLHELPARLRWYQRVPWAQIAATAALVTLAVTIWSLVPTAGDAGRSVASVEGRPDAAGAEQAAPPAVAADDEEAGVGEGADDASAELAMTSDADADADADAAAAGQPSVAAPWWQREPEAVVDGKLVDADVAPAIVDGSRVESHEAQRSFLGVVGEDGKTVYFLELREERTAVNAIGGEI